MTPTGKFTVIKFGGTSVSSLKCWKTIKEIASDRLKRGLKPVIVCSAVAGVSNELENALKFEPVLSNIENIHKELAKELNVDISEISEPLKELSMLLKGAELVNEAGPRLRAKGMAYGELVSTKLGAAYLNREGLRTTWQDARECLTALESFTNNPDRDMLSASCDYKKDPELIERFSKGSGVILTQGFIAGNGAGDTVLLGRGGSDISASYFAAKLNASVCEIWTDVPGMYTANPRQIPSARLIRVLDYDEAQEIASSGAKVLHPRCLAPVKKCGIPLKIYCLEHPKMDGTLVASECSVKDACVKAISSKKGITLISMESVDMWHQVGFLSDVFSCFKRNGISIDLVSTSETNVTVTLDQTTNVLTKETLKKLITELNAFCQAKTIDSCAMVSMVGRNIRSILSQLAPALEVFEEQKIYLVSQAANDLNLTFVVDEDQADRLVIKLHEQLFKQRGRDKLLGDSWQALFEKNGKEPERLPDTWWLNRKDELIAIAKKSSPLYVYEEGALDRSLSKISRLNSIDRVFYSIKANRQRDILKKFYDEKLGFECVSPFEVKYILELFPKIDPKRILFTPNFASKNEYEYAFEKKVIVTLDNLFPIKGWPDLLKGKEVFVRVDPGHGQGHHKYVHTAGIRSKFGVSPEQFDELADSVKRNDIKVKGLHTHVGSNIFTPETWSNNARFMASMAGMFPEAEVFDLGGGLGIVEKPGRIELDMGTLNTMLQEVASAYPKYKLWIEPGRFLVAEAGVLLAKVTQTKKKDEYNYIGIDTGMNSLIRPALYGAHHEIVNLSKIGKPSNVVANIVGPICESGDILGYERPMPEPSEGDVILIATAGAYGHVMGSNYNMREPAKEYFLKR